MESKLVPCLLPMREGPIARVSWISMDKTQADGRQNMGRPGRPCTCSKATSPDLGNGAGGPQPHLQYRQPIKCLSIHCCFPFQENNTSFAVCYFFSLLVHFHTKWQKIGTSRHAALTCSTAVRVKHVHSLPGWLPAAACRA
jgi:hypothetical protein